VKVGDINCPQFFDFIDGKPLKRNSKSFQTVYSYVFEYFIVVVKIISEIFSHFTKSDGSYDRKR